MAIIKTSRHSLKFANISKQDNLNAFMIEFLRVKWSLVDYFWTTKISWSADKVMDITNNRLDVPTFISTTNIELTTDISARALKLASGQALEVIKSATEKRRKQLYILNKLISEGDAQKASYLQKIIDSKPLVNPKRQHNESVRLDSNCCEYISGIGNEFDGFLKLKCLGKSYGHILLPIKNHRHANNLKSNGYQQMTTWALTKDMAMSHWKSDDRKSTGTKILGADQGQSTCLSLSDGQVTTFDIHGHDLHSICQKLSRKQKGSKAFKRAQAHRTNYVRAAINQLDFTDVKEVRLEELFQMRKGQKSSRSLSHWTYTEINAQVKKICQELGVQVIEQASTYRSQRCSDCGWVQKSNRKGKEFVCKQCGTCIDSDINGAKNHVVDLPKIPYGFTVKKYNRDGFYWSSDGIFDLSGQEITVPDAKRT